MKLFQYVQDGRVRLGVRLPQGLCDLSATAAKRGLSVPQTMLEAATQGVSAIQAALDGADPVWLDEKTVRFAPAVTGGEKTFCVGVNYAAHAAETGHTLPPAPEIFCKLPNAQNAHGGVVPVTPAATRYDYEAELVVVVGRTCYRASREEAKAAIFGYTCGNDLTARDIQRRTSQWVLGKNLDGCGPTGPYVVTADSLDAGNLTIESAVNGQRRQYANTSDLIFKPEDLLCDLSQFVTLRPGDLIFTGTPDGVIAGYPPEKQVWLKAGDVVDVKIEHIGTLTVTLA